MTLPAVQPAPLVIMPLIHPAIISDNGARVVWGSEGTGLVFKREDSPLHREIGSFAFVVLMDARVDVVGTADGQAGIAKLDHHKARFTVLVQRRVAPLSGPPGT